MSNNIYLLFSCLLFSFVAQGQGIPSDQTKINKETALNFYTDLWLNNHTENYAKYLADTYTVHDIGDRKGVAEEAVEQKDIADFFWKNGKPRFKLDYQIAEGDLVATRWIAFYEPETMVGKLAIGTKPIPIINVFRFENGKIVEIWNHRHDIDTNQTMKFVLKGLLFGLMIALIPAFYAFRLRKKIRNLKKDSPSIISNE